MDIYIVSNSLVQTRDLGKKIGSILKAGSVVCLTGDLGSGKTTLVQGIAEGLGVSTDYYITSPTFTLINEYPGRHTFYHADLYRLNHEVDFEDIGLLDLFFQDGVVAIEWAEKLTEEIEHQVTINLKMVSDHSRLIKITSFEPEMVEFLKTLENEINFH